MKKKNSLKKLSSEKSTPTIPKKQQPNPLSKPLSEEEYKEYSQEIISEDQSMNIALNNNGESVLVTVRIRPMNSNEISRGDDTCVRILNDRELQIYQKGSQKLYQFNAVLPDSTKQDEVFMKCSISVGLFDYNF